MTVSRRRLFSIFAAAGSAAFVPGHAAQPETVVWTGTALGADARIVIAGLSQDDAQRAARLARNEALRLEQAFSLYRPDSEISRLNRDGMLDGPSQDFRILLARSLEAWTATGGAFNPAIQPVWSHLARHFAARPGCPPDTDALRRVLPLCDPSRISVSPSRIALAPGMALTFNGIAQGYITDAAARALEAHGLRDILIELGEIYALPGKTWSIGIDGSGRRLNLSQRAVAQSAGHGTPFTADGRWHHLIDPTTGESANHYAAVTVVASSATDADLLSTSLYVAPVERHHGILAHFPGTETYLQAT